jgi:hypothetical protein
LRLGFLLGRTFFRKVFGAGFVSVITAFGFILFGYFVGLEKRLDSYRNGKEGKTDFPGGHFAFSGAIFVGLLFYFLRDISRIISVEGRGKEEIPSVTFSFNVGSVGFPFAEGMLKDSHFEK